MLGRYRASEVHSVRRELLQQRCCTLGLDLGGGQHVEVQVRIANVAEDDVVRA